MLLKQVWYYGPEFTRAHIAHGLTRAVRSSYGADHTRLSSPNARKHFRVCTFRAPTPGSCSGSCIQLCSFSTPSYPTPYRFVILLDFSIAHTVVNPSGATPTLVVQRRLISIFSQHISHRGLRILRSSVYMCQRTVYTTLSTYP